MKKRTLVCFLIFLLCVFHSSIPDTVFGQDAEPTSAELAQTVYDEYSATLLREDLATLVDQVLEALSDPATLQNPVIAGLGLDAALDQLLASPGLITLVVPDADASIIALLTNDEDIRGFLRDKNVRTLLQDTEAVNALTGLNCGR